MFLWRSDLCGLPTRQQEAVRTHLSTCGVSGQRGAERGRSSAPDVQVDVDVVAHLEGGDVPDDGDGAHDVNDTLVDAHLKAIPGVGALAARRLPAGDAENLGRDSDGTAGLVALAILLGSGDDLGAGVLQRLNLSALQSESKRDVSI